MFLSLLVGHFAIQAEPARQGEYGVPVGGLFRNLLAPDPHCRVAVTGPAGRVAIDIQLSKRDARIDDVVLTWDPPVSEEWSSPTADVHMTISMVFSVTEDGAPGELRSAYPKGSYRFHDETRQSRFTQTASLPDGATQSWRPDTRYRPLLNRLFRDSLPQSVTFDLHDRDGDPVARSVVVLSDTSVRDAQARQAYSRASEATVRYQAHLRAGTATSYVCPEAWTSSYVFQP